MRFDWVLECDGCGAGDLGDSWAAVDVGCQNIAIKEVKVTAPPVRNRGGVLCNHRQQSQH